MEGDEAIKIASAWVETRYPVVPPVASAFQFRTDFSNDVLELNPGINIEEAQKYNGRWVVGFFCSWDTDALGMPERLIVFVDNDTQEVEIAPTVD